jgi:hypothetical protein
MLELFPMSPRSIEARRSIWMLFSKAKTTISSLNGTLMSIQPELSICLWGIVMLRSRYFEL